MIGRGTRVLETDPALRKPWCPEKDRFLIIDCWGNFEYFEMHPKGRELGQQVPLPVRLFRARLAKLEAALASAKVDVAQSVIADLRADLAGLPTNNVIVLENQGHLGRIREDSFWTRLSREAIEFLSQTIAPILRAQSDADYKVLRFTIDVVELSAALLAGNRDAFDALRETVIEQVSELPLGVNLVARERDVIAEVQNPDWWARVTDAKLRDLAVRLGPLMRFRPDDQSRRAMLSLNLADITAVHQRIVVADDGRDMPIAAYRQRVEETVVRLLTENPVLERLQAGEAVSESDLQELAQLLRRQDPGIDEARLRKVYDLRQASFVSLIRHVLGVEPLERWPTRVTREFEEFIAQHSNYSALQIRFLQTLRTFILHRGTIERRNLVEPPFTQLHPRGIRGIFSPSEIEAILGFAKDLVA